MQNCQDSQEQKIIIDDLSINYKILGQGAPIVILHGWGASSDSWIRVQKILTERNYQVIVPDLPGFGKSDAAEKPWGVGEYADFVLQFTQTVQGSTLNKFVLIGHSFGGRIGIKFAAQYPEKLLGLILVASAGIDREKNLGQRQKLIFKTTKAVQRLFLVPGLKRLYPITRKSVYKIAGTRDFYLIKDPVMKKTFQKIIEEDLTQELSKIKKPTLIIWGDKDKLIPVSIAQRIKTHLPQADLVVLKNIGHNPHRENPELLSEKILNFIEILSTQKQEPV